MLMNNMWFHCLDTKSDDDSWDFYGHQQTVSFIFSWKCRFMSLKFEYFWLKCLHCKVSRLSAYLIWSMHCALIYFYHDDWRRKGSSLMIASSGPCSHEVEEEQDNECSRDTLLLGRWETPMEMRHDWSPRSITTFDWWWAKRKYRSNIKRQTGQMHHPPSAPQLLVWIPN